MFKIFFLLSDHHEVFIPRARWRVRRHTVFQTDQNKRLTNDARRGSTQHETKVNGILNVQSNIKDILYTIVSNEHSV